MTNIYNMSGEELVSSLRPELERFFALCDNGAIEPIALMFRSGHPPCQRCVLPSPASPKAR